MKIWNLKLLFTGGNSKDSEYKLAQSGDATCNGLDSAEVWIQSIKNEKIK